MTNVISLTATNINYHFDKQPQLEVNSVPH